MQVGSIFGGHISTANFANSVNHRLEKDKADSAKSGSITDYFKSSVKKDSGKDHISNLMDRKQKILDQKEQKRQSDIAKGYDSKAIDADLAQYDSMAAEIDQQIAQAKQDEIKKAQKGKTDDAQNGKKDSKVSSGSPDDIRMAAAEQTSQNMQAISSLQATEQNIEAVKSARRALKVEALSYQPSFAFAGHSETAAKLNAKADGLQGKINHMEHTLNGAAKKVAETSDDTVKSMQETEVDKYKESDKSLNKDADNGDLMDVYA